MIERRGTAGSHARWMAERRATAGIRGVTHNMDDREKATVCSIRIPHNIDEREKLWLAE